MPQKLPLWVREGKNKVWKLNTHKIGGTAFSNKTAVHLKFYNIKKPVFHNISKVSQHLVFLSRPKKQTVLLLWCKLFHSYLRFGDDQWPQTSLWFCWFSAMHLFIWGARYEGWWWRTWWRTCTIMYHSQQKDMLFQFQPRWHVPIVGQDPGCTMGLVAPTWLWLFSRHELLGKAL